MTSALAGLAALFSILAPSFDQVANLAPLLACAALVCFGTALSVGSSKSCLAAALLGFFAPIGLMAPDVVAAIQESASGPSVAPQLKVISANLWSLNHDYKGLEAMVAAEAPDILIVQEAFGGWKLELERLAPTYHIVAGCTYDNECNAVVLSKLKKLCDIATPKSWSATLQLELPERFGGGAFEVMSVHLSRPPPILPQRLQIEELISVAGSFGSRAFIAGDFNATPWSSSIRRLDRALALERRSRALFSWPKPFPIAPVDHVYAGPDWRLIEIHRGPDIGSDHYPVVATFSLAAR